MCARWVIVAALLVVGARTGQVSAADVIYVSSLNNDEVLRYDAATGAYIDTFITVASGGGMDNPHGTLERCDDLLLASFASHRIVRYDVATGAFLDVFADAGSGLNNPVYLVVGPDENLYVSNQGSDEILRFTPDGTLIDAFVSAGSGGLDGPSGFAFGPDGRLYVVGRHSANVIAYDGTTGAFDEVIADSSDGLVFGSTFGLAFGDNDDLYFASGSNVYRYDLDTASIVATIPVSGIGLEAGPAGGVYVATANNLRVISTVDNSVSGPVLTGGVISTLNFFHFGGLAGSAACQDVVPTLGAKGLVSIAALLVAAGVAILRRRVAYTSKV